MLRLHSQHRVLTYGWTLARNRPCRIIRSIVMDSFLQRRKECLVSGEKRVTIVAGNEACDLDSMTSAILFAWFRSEDSSAASSAKTYVPLLNIPKEDTKLRPEFQALFTICHTNIDNLITLTDLPKPEVLPPEQTDWVLVDHNKLDSNLSRLYQDRVLGCIDHRDEENSVPKGNTSEPRIIEKCGSCTSLVLREAATSLLDEKANLEDNPKYDSNVLKLGLASILIDTNNLQDASKTRKTDQDVAKRIDKILSARSSGWDRDAFFNEIDKAKRNLDGLSFNDVLRKDYKQWSEADINLGTSSVVRDLDFVDSLLVGDRSAEVNPDQYATAAPKFMEERKLHIWAIMTAFPKKQKDGDQMFQRQLRLHWCDDQSKRLIDQFQERYGEELKLELLKDNQISSKNKQGWMTWQQGNVGASRKQVAPMIRTIMNQNSKL